MHRTKKMIFYFLFYVTLGFIISVLQQIVLKGFPLRFDNFFWEEWLGSSIYIFLYIQMQRKILSSFTSAFKKEEKSVPLLTRYFFILQVAGFVLLMGFSTVFTALLHGKINIRLKDIVELRFIFVYFFFIHSVVYVTGVALRLYKLYIKEKDAKHYAEKSFLSAQLNMLRQQLNPHFLFNNLNIIASTINSNPKLAYDFTRSMASFYRKVLEAENAGWVLVKDELSTIEAYLYMLSVRFEEKISFKIEVSAFVKNNCSIPDFVLQPIVENAIKHNSFSKANPLVIEIINKDDETLLIKNSYLPKQGVDDSLGIGWFNIESRYKYLEAKAPLKYIEDNWFMVEVSLLKKIGS